MKAVYLASLALALCAPAQAIDLQSYRKYQEYQHTGQAQELELAREALGNGDVDTAQTHLDAARNMAYAPEEIAALERQIAAERTRIEQARRASEQRETQNTTSPAAASASGEQGNGWVTFHVAFGALYNTTDQISVEVVDNSSPSFKLTNSGSAYATVHFMKAGNYTVQITAHAGERVFNFSSQFYHPGAIGLMCNYHMALPDSSSSVFGGCEAAR